MKAYPWILLALTGCFDSFRRTPKIHDEIISDLEDNSADDNSDSILVFATLFDIFKSYQNSVVVEISSILPGEILRYISLGSTEGFNSYNTIGHLTYQPIVYLIGRNVLGRLFNVTGSIIDMYNEVAATTPYMNIIYLPYKSDKCLKRDPKIVSSKDYLQPCPEAANLFRECISHINVKETSLEKLISLYCGCYLGQTSDPIAPVSRLPIPTELARAPLKHMVKNYKIA